MKRHHIINRLFLILADQVFILLAFWLVSMIRGTGILYNLSRTHPWLLIFLIIHLGLAMVFDKYNFQQHTAARKKLLPVIYSNLAFVGAASILFVLSYQLGVPRTLFFGTVAIATIMELTAGWVIHLFQSAKTRNNINGFEPVTSDTESAYAPAQVAEPATPNTFLTIRGQNIRKSILDELGPGAFDYLKNHVSLGDSSIVLSVNNRVNIMTLPTKNIDTIVNLQKVNNHRRVNKFFETVNLRLPPGGQYAGVAEPQCTRKKRILQRYTPVFGIILYSFDFLWRRVAPKLPVFKRVYFCLTKGKNRVMSRAEVLGRLYACGFEVVNESLVDGLLFFVARKVRNPHFDEHPTYGPLIGLRRIGQHGKIIGVYKMRTMHPYAEYLQPYIHKLSDLEKGGKFGNDFRISTCGKIMRKLWIDEQPMWINWLKGDLKLVGVRPLSEHYFSLYTKEHQDKRIKVKPGLIPPYYADMPETLEEIMASESRYIDAYLRAPVTTDWRYFWKAFFNIVFRHARST